MAAGKTPDHRWLRGIATAALLSAVASAAAAAPAAAARHAPAVISANHPRGYKIVSSGLANAPPSAFYSGISTTCPAGTVVWGGGVAFAGSANANLILNSSNPNGTSGWAGKVINAGATTAQFGVDAVCADKPRGYKFVSQEVDNPPHTQTDATATCPPLDVLLGGGVLSTADQGSVVLTSAWPLNSTFFTVYLANLTGSDVNLVVYAICGHQPAGYKIVSNSGSVGSGGTLVDSVSCPAGTSALDGGAQVLDHNPLVQVGGSLNQGTSRWATTLNNLGPSVEQVDGYAICAA